MHLMPEKSYSRVGRKVSKYDLLQLVTHCLIHHLIPIDSQMPLSVSHPSEFITKFRTFLGRINETYCISSLPFGENRYLICAQKLSFSSTSIVDILEFLVLFVLLGILSAWKPQTHYLLQVETPLHSPRIDDWQCACTLKCQTVNPRPQDWQFTIHSMHTPWNVWILPRIDDSYDS